MLRFSIGIDIGKEGSIVIQETGKIKRYPMPMIKKELDYAALHKILEPYKEGNGIIVFEKLGVIFGTSKATAFSMGHQAGSVEMLCIALSIPFVKVPPKTWQKEMFMGVEEASRKSSTGKTQVRDTKAMALVAAKRLFPAVQLTFGDRATKPHDGLVDALLLSEYGRRRYA